MEKIIEGYNNRYTIDEFGNIYSKGKKMSPYKINSGYLAIKLRNKGNAKAYLVHRLVAKYFISGNEDNVVDHIDGNRLNNNATNLRYCTQKENLYYNGYDYNSGINHYKSVFTIQEVQFIRKCREENGMRNKDIYNLFPNISHSAIDQILNYKTYKGIPS